MHPLDRRLQLLVAVGDVRDTGRAFAAQYVRGANCNALQIGSTPNSPRCASM